MLTIRRAQLDAFSAAAQSRFEKRLTQHLAGQAKAGMVRAPSEWAQLARVGIEHARTYELITEGDVTHFVELMALHGMSFPDLPDLGWAKTILRDRTLAPSLRLALVRQQLAARTAPDTRE